MNAAIQNLLQRAFRCGVVLLSVGLVHTGQAQRITTPNGTSLPYYFSASGTNVAAGTSNQTITLYAGATYKFTIATASIHPVDVNTNATTTSHYTNASPQAITGGTITITIPPTGYPTTLYYICNIHGFFGIINVLPPQPPPPNTILSVQVTTNIVVLSTGTSNSYTIVPQFSSNLLSGLWQPVTLFTNTFNNGTNTTVFDRLDDICGPNVFLRISQQPPQ